MSFWQENRVFVVVIAVAVVALFFLWPSLFNLDPAVVSFHRTAYERTALARRQLREKLEQLYPKSGNNVTVSEALQQATDANQVLLANFEEMHRWMSFVPRFPFRIPDTRQGNERRRYVSLCYTYARTGELICDEYKKTPLNEPNDGVIFRASPRRIRIADPAFGLRDMELPESITNPETCIMQIALIQDLGHLAISLGVDEITSIAPAEPYTWSVKDTKVATAYPINLRVQCDLPTLLGLLHALDGAHGRVVEAPAALPTPEEPPPDATTPVAPEPKPNAPLAEEGAAGATDEKPAPAPEPKDAAPRKITVQLNGSPSVFAPTPDEPTLKDRLTIFRPSGDDAHEMEFVANAIITRVLDGGRVEAVIERNSCLSFSADGKVSTNVVRKGDFASSRFFLVRGLKVKSVEAKVEKDKDGFPADINPNHAEVVPAHLDVELSVAALRFLKVEMPKETAPTSTAPKLDPKKPTHKRL